MANSNIKLSADNLWVIFVAIDQHTETKLCELSAKEFITVLRQVNIDLAASGFYEE